LAARGAALLHVRLNAGLGVIALQNTAACLWRNESAVPIGDSSTAIVLDVREIWVQLKIELSAKHVELLDLHFRIDQDAIHLETVTSHFASAWREGAPRYPGLLSNFLDPICKLTARNLLRGVLTVAIHLFFHRAVVFRGAYRKSDAKRKNGGSELRNVRNDEWHSDISHDA
jgi:hypothetical protein